MQERRPDQPERMAEGSDYTRDDQSRGGDMAGQATERAQQAGEQAQEKAQEMRAATMDRAEEGREQAAGAMSSAADRMRDMGGDNMAGQASSRVANQMERTAGYLREHDTTEIRDDVERYVREHPMQSMGAAIVAGFFVGRMLR